MGRLIFVQICETPALAPGAHLSWRTVPGSVRG